MLETAKLLLDRGADPNSHYWIEGSYKFTCVTDAIGEGENGVKTWPPHQHARALVTLLLEGVADPNDGQGLYNSMFTCGTHWLELLLDHGLTNEQPANSAGDNEISNMDYQLVQACNANQLDRVKLLLERGANPNSRSIFDNRTCYQHAVGARNSEIAELVVRHGGERIEPDSPQEQFYNACMVANREAVDSMRDQHSDNEIASWIQAGESRLPQAAANNKLDAIRFMLELGLPTSTALFEAAWNGHMDVAKLLVDHGVSASQRHKDHSATPIDYADAADHMELRGCLHLCNTL